ncbi:MAG: aldo/keto reductase [Opitutales bacterium]
MPETLYLLGVPLALFPICLGTGNLGIKPPEGEAFSLLDAYVAAGGNFIDTAKIYNEWVPGELRRSERIIGDWMALRKNREQLVIATKGAHPNFDDGKPRLTPEAIQEDLDGSLQKLRVESIDLYYLHKDAPELPVEPVIDVLNANVRVGKMRALGASNWTAARIAEANAYAARSGQHGFVANQPLWSLGSEHQRPRGLGMLPLDTEAFAFHQQTQLPVIPYSAQAEGFFEKWVHADAPARARLREHHYGTETNIRRAEVAEDIARDRGWSVTEVVLAWLRSQPFPVIPIIAAGNSEQLRQSLKAADKRLEPAEMQRLAEA